MQYCPPRTESFPIISYRNQNLEGSRQDFATCSWALTCAEWHCCSVCCSIGIWRTLVTVGAVDTLSKLRVTLVRPMGFVKAGHRSVTFASIIDDLSIWSVPKFLVPRSTIQTRVVVMPEVLHCSISIITTVVGHQKGLSLPTMGDSLVCIAPCSCASCHCVLFQMGLPPMLSRNSQSIRDVYSHQGSTVPETEIAIVHHKQ